MNRFLTFLKSRNLTQLIIISVILGLIAGLLFGERMSSLKIFGDIFIKLIQMTVIPYVVVALIRGFASFSYKELKDLVKYGGTAFLIVWGSTLAVVFLLPKTFPEIDSGSFFSTTLLEQSEKVDLVKLFIPSNPLAALSEGAIPAIVLFCIVMGLAFINVKNKKVLIETFSALEEGLDNLSDFFFRFSPIGIFCLVANAAGTLELQELASMQVFLVSYAAGAIFLSLIAIPLLLTAFLPFSYLELLRASKEALVLSFCSRNSFIVMPLLIKEIKKLYRKQGVNDEAVIEQAAVMIPLSANFPTIGKLLYIVFILFSGWFYDMQISLFDQLLLALNGLVNSFGSSTGALPFLLDQLKIPIDAFEIYLVSKVVTKNFQTLGNTIGMFAVGMIYIGFISKQALFSPFKVISALLAITLTFGALLFSVDNYFRYTVSESQEQVSLLMNLQIESPAEVVVYKEKPKDPLYKREPGKNLYRQIDESGVLKVGYNTNSLPFAYFNAKNELVGFDIAMAHKLANYLGVKLIMIPFDYNTVTDDINSGEIDIAMSSVVMEKSRIYLVDFSNPYMQLHLSMVVPDYKREEFSNLSEVAKDKTLKIAAMRGSAYLVTLQKLLPHATIVEIDERKDFFENNVADVLLTTAEQGYAWSLLYPKYSVVLMNEKGTTSVIGYPIHKENLDLLYNINQWIVQLRDKGIFKKEYDRWILGKGKIKKEKRWSLLDNYIIQDD